MNDAIAVLNAGSSSLKFSIYQVAADTIDLLSHGQIEGLGTAPWFEAKDAKGQEFARVALDCPTHGSGHAHALTYLLRWGMEQYGHQWKLRAVGHRVVHGGLEFSGPTLVDAAVEEKLEQLVHLAPLHQPHNLVAIREFRLLRPDLPQVACFDTAFHRHRAQVTERFGLPDEMFAQGIRRWGFHGLSYESIAGKFRQIAPQIAAGRVIAAHLGNGASLCAMKNGRSVDTTMSFSVLDGLPMGTRCGSIDPGVILFLLERGWSPPQIEKFLYHESGLQGISGISNDVRDLLASDAPRAKEAIEFLVYRIVREIGSLTAALGGLDALIFTAGIGENSPVIRQQVCQSLAWLGIRLDAGANQHGSQCLSLPDQKPSVWVIPTDEEAVIAAHTLAVVRSQANSP